MKKKKIILSVCIASILLLASLLFFAFSSGSKIKKGEIYLFGTSDGLIEVNFDGLPVFPEDLEYSDSDDSHADEEKTVTVQGKQYTGKIDGGDVHSVLSDQMEYTYMGEGFHFRIGAESGKLTFFSLYTEKCDTYIDVEEGKQIAIDFLSDIIDIDNFTVTKSEESGMATVNVMEYRFVRYIEGVETGEQIWVNVNANGIITKYISTALGDFENETSLDGLTVKDFVEPIKVKLKEIDSEQEKYALTLKESTAILEKKNGRIICVFDVDCNDENGIGELISIAYVVD